MAAESSESEVLAQELDSLGQRVHALETRFAEVERIIEGLETAALTTARALEDVSAHWDSVYRRCAEQSKRAQNHPPALRLGRQRASTREAMSPGKQDSTVGPAPLGPFWRKSGSLSLQRVVVWMADHGADAYSLVDASGGCECGDG
jgi:uncharacterized coiled-coil protein SlyX